MNAQHDIAGYSPDQELVLIGEVKALTDSSQTAATYFRRNLVSHGLLPRDTFFLLAFGLKLYLWKPRAELDSAPDFSAEAQPVLKKFLGRDINAPREAGPESLELAVKLWLSEIISRNTQQANESAADKMLADSGLLAKLKGGVVRAGTRV